MTYPITYFVSCNQFAIGLFVGDNTDIIKTGCISCDPLLNIVH